VADSVGVGFPTSNLQKGHTFFDLDDQSEWLYLGGDPKSVASWRLKNGVFGSDPDTSLWGAPQTGAQWFNTSLGLMRFWTGVAAASIGSGGGGSSPSTPGYDFTTGSFLQEDFTGGSTWALSAGSVTQITDTTSNPGVMSIATGTTINTVAYFTSYSLDFVRPEVIVSCNMVVETTFADALTHAMWGFFNGSGFPPTRFIGFEKDTVSANYTAIVKNGGAILTLDTGVIIDAKMKRWGFTISGTTATFTYDGATLGTLDISSLLFANYRPGVVITNLSAANRSMRLDYFDYTQTLPGSRTEPED
jgi:hypothetical protein